jgi:hypothetical protein
VLLRRRLAVLVATASLVVMMLLAMAPVAMALPLVPQKGRGPFGPPPGSAPGGVFRSETGKLHDSRQHETGPRPTPLLPA